MEYPNPKIKYYRMRTFGERLNVSFDYLRETWKPVLKFTLYLILPICLIQSFTVNSVMHTAFYTGFNQNGSFGDLVSFTVNYGVYCLCILLGSAMLSALVYTLMQEYERRETRLMNIRAADIKLLLVRNLKKIIGASLFMCAVIIAFAGVIVLLALISPWTVIVSVLLLTVICFVVMVPLALFLPVYVFEDKPLFPALRKAFSFGFKAWGGTLLVMIVFGFLSNIISMATMMPWYLMTLIINVMDATNYTDGITEQLWYKFIIYLLGIIQSYGIYLAMIITSVGYAFQYFHVREQQERVSADDSIRNFDKL
jgi:hypothetical protein